MFVLLRLHQRDEGVLLRFLLLRKNVERREVVLKNEVEGDVLEDVPRNKCDKQIKKIKRSRKVVEGEKKSHQYVQRMIVSFFLFERRNYETTGNKI